jgi:hypothetical protein
MKIRRIDFSPDEFLAGTFMLPDIELAIYWRACALIYSRNAPIDIADLRRICSTRKDRFEEALDNLVGDGKLTRNLHEIDNKRARKELEISMNRARTWHENGSKGGRPSNKTNGIAKPSGLAPRARAEPSTINHHIDSVASATGADAPSFDPVKEIFDRGLRILGQAQRSLLGKLRKQHGDVAVLEAICACESEHPSDPAPFLIRSCKAHSAPKRKSPSTTLWEGAYNAAQNYIRDHGIDRDDNLPAQPLLDSGRPPRIA